MRGRKTDSSPRANDETRGSVARSSGSWFMYEQEKEKRSLIFTACSGGPLPLTLPCVLSVWSSSLSPMLVRARRFYCGSNTYGTGAGRRLERRRKRLPWTNQLTLV